MALSIVVGTTSRFLASTVISFILNLALVTDWPANASPVFWSIARAAVSISSAVCPAVWAGAWVVGGAGTAAPLGFPVVLDEAPVPATGLGVATPKGISQYWLA